MATRRKNGLTLVEVIVTLIIVVILAGIIFSIYLTQAREVAISSAYAQLNRSYDNFIETFGRDIRFANNISPIFPISTDPTNTDPTYTIFATNNDSTVRYSINNETNTLYRDVAFPPDYYDFSSFTPFSTGNGVLPISNNDEIEKDSYFRILTATTVSSTLFLTVNDGEETIDFLRREDFFKCRN